MSLFVTEIKRQAESLQPGVFSRFFFLVLLLAVALD